MQNFVQSGDTVTLPAPYDVHGGDGLLVGSIFGVATSDALSGANVETKLKGVFDLKKKNGDTPAAGALLYWDNSGKQITTTSTSNKLVGVALAAAASGDATTRLRLNGSFIS